jgi:hypothetical protein
MAKLDRQRQAEAAALLRSPRAAREAALREWLAGHMERTDPAPGQLPDTMLGSKAGDLNLIKGMAVSEPLLFARITKAVPLDDGSLEVHGIASSEQRDEQNEIVTAEAVRQALPAYKAFPCIRAMHQPIAVGTALEVDVGADKITRVVCKIVDKDAITKVRARVYRGFSLGGRVTQRDESDPTIITGLKLDELSLCDRPANSSAVLTLWKAQPEPPPLWDCGDRSHNHDDQTEAAWCRVYREKDEQVKKLKKLQKAAEKRADELLSRPIVPDTSDLHKAAQARADFMQLYYAGRRQMVDQRFVTRR